MKDFDEIQGTFEASIESILSLADSDPAIQVGAIDSIYASSGIVYESSNEVIGTIVKAIRDLIRKIWKALVKIAKSLVNLFKKKVEKSDQTSNKAKAIEKEVKSNRTLEEISRSIDGILEEASLFVISDEIKKSKSKKSKSKKSKSKKSTTTKSTTPKKSSGSNTTPPSKQTINTTVPSLIDVLIKTKNPKKTAYDVVEQQMILIKTNLLIVSGLQIEYEKYLVRVSRALNLFESKYISNYSGITVKELKKAIYDGASNHKKVKSGYLAELEMDGPIILWKPKKIKNNVTSSTDPDVAVKIINNYLDSIRGGSSDLKGVPNARTKIPYIPTLKFAKDITGFSKDLERELEGGALSSAINKLTGTNLPDLTLKIKNLPNGMTSNYATIATTFNKKSLSTLSYMANRYFNMTKFLLINVRDIAGELTDMFEDVGRITNSQITDLKEIKRLTKSLEKVDIKVQIETELDENLLESIEHLNPF